MCGVQDLDQSVRHMSRSVVTTIQGSADRRCAESVLRSTTAHAVLQHLRLPSTPLPATPVWSALDACLPAEDPVLRA